MKSHDTADGERVLKTPTWKISWEDWSGRLRAAGTSFTAEDAFQAGFLWGSYEGQQIALQPAQQSALPDLIAENEIFRAAMLNASAELANFNPGMAWRLHYLATREALQEKKTP